MSAAESTKTLAGRPWPDGSPSTWLYVADLPTPPEVVREVEELRKKMGWWWRWWWKKQIEEATQRRKCYHYFLAKQIVYKETPRGMLVMIAGEPGSDEVFAFRASVASEERENTIAWTLYDESLATDWFHI